jgi:hypothetical protein
MGFFDNNTFCTYYDELATVIKYKDLKKYKSYQQLINGGLIL